MKESNTNAKNNSTIERLTDLELLAMLKSDLRSFKKKKENQQQSLQAA